MKQSSQQSVITRKVTIYYSPEHNLVRLVHYENTYPIMDFGVPKAHFRHLPEDLPKMLQGFSYVGSFSEDFEAYPQ